MSPKNMNFLFKLILKISIHREDCLLNIKLKTYSYLMNLTLIISYGLPLIKE